MSTTPDQLAIEHAERDLAIVEVLLESPGWQYLTRRLTEERDRIRSQIADDSNLSDLDTRTLRAVVAHYNEILKLPARDRGIHGATLARAHERAKTPDRFPRLG